MNSQAFSSNTRLGILNLNLNNCISEEFRFIEDLNEVRKTIKESCGYCEIDVAEMVELKMTVELKMQEIENLLAETERKSAEIVEKDEKIKKLEDKIQQMENITSQFIKY